MGVRAVACALLLVSVGAARAGESEDKERARAAYTEGVKLYKIGEFKRAQEAFKKAYLIRPDPAFLYNLGQCARMLDEPDDSTRYYSNYLREVPDSPQRRAVERFLRDAEEEIRARAGRRAPPTGTIPPEEAAERPARHEAPVEQPPARQIVEEPAHKPVEEERPAAKAEAPADEGGGTPVYKKWWLWTIVAVAVAAVAVGVSLGVIYGSPQDAPTPVTGLGSAVVTF
jgi:tetratricopeptide (TPR) repeat protein